jgi:hypothetical protein
MKSRLRSALLPALILLPGSPLFAGIGDVQLMSDDPWYPGELAISSFERLAATQGALYERVTGRKVETDEDKALASWFWRNTHFAHGEEGRCDLYGEGFEKSDWNREYWNGLFSHGFALCGTTHAQWTAEMEMLLGHCRARSVGVSGHNSFEIFLKGGAYGEEGRWALLDHDLSTVVFDEEGTRLLSIAELGPALKTLGDPDFKPERQRGWRVAGLHPDDIGSFSSFRVAEYLSGYAGPPPMVHLRKGETFTRYPEPGLEDGKTFVFWGRNYRTDDVPGPERSRTWVNQPEKMFQATRDAGHHNGQARYGNAVFLYRPNFKDGSYKEGVIDEGPEHVTFEFTSPYVIAATPPDDSDWGIYKPGGRNGLVLTSEKPVSAKVSTDAGTTWHAADGNDFTDLVKGRTKYLLRLEAEAKELAGAGLEIRTVCQANPATMPRLHDGVNKITLSASGRALVSAGPEIDHAMAHAVDGSLDSSSVTLKLASPRGERIVALHAASHNLSGSPPNPEVIYAIDYSLDAGKTWSPFVKDWRIERKGEEPPDFWSQSFTYGSKELEPVEGAVLVRFSNDGGKKYRRVEAHLEYRVEPNTSAAVKCFADNSDGRKRFSVSHTFDLESGAQQTWNADFGKGVRRHWVEIAAP